MEMAALTESCNSISLSYLDYMTLTTFKALSKKEKGEKNTNHRITCWDRLCQKQLSDIGNAFMHLKNT